MDAVYNVLFFLPLVNQIIHELILERFVRPIQEDCYSFIRTFKVTRKKKRERE